MIILSLMYPWTRKAPLNFGSTSGVRIQTLDPDVIHLRRGKRSPSAVTAVVL